ncbi:MAG: nicotinamide riboside transporter PnuC [Salinivirgaceae bacterium]|jgi:nicotinamide mononucleotide transporter|nr:nicotinamide riboside transporter PnuC [Salinivirgaceae bacterium]
MIEWVFKNGVEILAVLTGLVYIFLSIRQNIWCWLFGIISSVLYLFLCFVFKIYADMSLQAYYVIMGIYGWIHWARLDNSNAKFELPVSSLTKKEIWLASSITVFLFFIIAQILIHFTDSPIPYVDSFTTSLSFTATWMLTRKIIEHWLIWIVVNTVSMGLYFYRELYLTIVLFAVLAVMAIIGYIEWKKEWKKMQTIPVS